MKTLKIVQLIIWLMIIAFLLIVLIMFVLGRANLPNFIKNEKQIELLQQMENVKGITGITLDLSSTDVVIKPSVSDEISITYRGPESIKDKMDLTVAVKDGQLTIKQSEIRQFFFLNMWNFTPRILEISLPESYSDDLVLGNSSGDLTISGAYQFSSFKSHLTSGDSRLENITCSDFSLDCTSGNVTLGSIVAKNLNISLTSGQIEAKALSGDGSIGTISGNIRINSLIGNARISVTSGDVQVSSLSGAGSVTCTSGNIDITVAKSLGDLSLMTSSGGVDVSFEKDAVYTINANCTSGDISSNFPLNYSNGKDSASGQIGNSPQNHLDARTTSGNIHLTT